MTEKFIHFCVSRIVKEPDSITLIEQKDPDATRFQLTVHPDDMKRVIGRGGRTIRALQSLVRAIGIKNNVRYFLNVVEPCSPQ